MSAAVNQRPLPRRATPRGAFLRAQWLCAYSALAVAVAIAATAALPTRAAETAAASVPPTMAAAQPTPSLFELRESARQQQQRLIGQVQQLQGRIDTLTDLIGDR